MEIGNGEANSCGNAISPIADRLREEATRRIREEKTKLVHRYLLSNLERRSGQIMWTERVG